MRARSFDHAGYQRRRYAQRHEDALNVLGRVCAVCGGTGAIEFRKRPDAPDRPQPVTRLFSRYSWEFILEELTHYHLLCATCRAPNPRSEPMPKKHPTPKSGTRRAHPHQAKVACGDDCPGRYKGDLREVGIAALFTAQLPEMLQTRCWAHTGPADTIHKEFHAAAVGFAIDFGVGDGQAYAKVTWCEPDLIACAEEMFAMRAELEEHLVDTPYG